MTVDRTPKPGYRHPTVRAYERGCRCLPCLNRRQRDRKHREKYGSSLVPSKPTIDHVTTLVEAGFTHQMISEVSGVPKATIHDITHKNRQRIQEMNALAILAVTPDMIRKKAEPSRRMPTLGARRRLHALSALGWTYRGIATSRTQYHLLISISLGQRAHIAQSSYDQIVDLYERYSGKPGPSEQSRKRARLKGWAPPLAWDDDSIDDPHAQPNFGQLPDESDTRMDLYQQGLSDGQIGAAVGVSTDAIQKWRTRRNLPANYYTREGRAS